ncbi:hypothetical protein OB2597_08564 [Pseudooceanicola batsensis HTCC2597]|uniref:Uncharacterized protein n=1 Tax=Pseudooceanicola batsensis (strain ATCC BAA-863 / DSM 15984 / KCTC 12145 / HTCC2597) TaxID=252305 RepID=A3TUI5_PSEBH|nr:hypothetical protein [Pseudooceanicola batsensis]EAQ04181.1 hypothetical protein OB2597_08564 [Pseudooceanicola batsensis HTCC2597]
MHFTITHLRGPDAPKSGSVAVGRRLGDTESPVLHDPPRRMGSRAARRDHAKGPARSPAVPNPVDRYDETPCPFGINLACTRNARGRPMPRSAVNDEAAERVPPARLATPRSP